LRLAGVPANGAVLDVATGPGFLLVELGGRLPGAGLRGADVRERMFKAGFADAE